MRGIIPQQRKKFNPSFTENFNELNAWKPLRGDWSTTSGTLTTPTAATSYPILTSYDLRSQNITATMSLNAAGPGVVFWLVDENNWWAGVTFYTQGIESYRTGTYSCEPCTSTGTYFGCSGPQPTCTVANGCPTGSGCGRWGTQICSTCYFTANRTRYNFFISILSSVNGTVSNIANINLRSTCSVSTQWSPCTAASNDNINGVQVSTSEDVITMRARDDANNFYGTSISITASNPNRGYKSGIIFTPGSSYLLDSSVQNISIVGE